MEKYIGRKVKGFRFEDEILIFSNNHKSCFNKDGEIISYDGYLNSFFIRFHNGIWPYPADLVIQQLESKSDKVYTRATPLLIELHKNYKGAKNIVRNYDSVYCFDNMDYKGDTGYFYAYYLGDIDRKRKNYQELTEQEFIEFMGLDANSKDNVNNPSHYTQGISTRTD